MLVFRATVGGDCAGFIFLELLQFLESGGSSGTDCSFSLASMFVTFASQKK